MRAVAYCVPICQVLSINKKTLFSPQEYVNCNLIESHLVCGVRILGHITRCVSMDEHALCVAVAVLRCLILILSSMTWQELWADLGQNGGSLHASRATPSVVAPRDTPLAPSLGKDNSFGSSFGRAGGMGPSTNFLSSIHNSTYLPSSQAQFGGGGGYMNGNHSSAPHTLPHAFSAQGSALGSSGMHAQQGYNPVSIMGEGVLVCLA
jgi:hypothetical protein